MVFLEFWSPCPPQFFRELTRCPCWETQIQNVLQDLLVVRFHVYQVALIYHEFNTGVLRQISLSFNYARRDIRFPSSIWKKRKVSVRRCLLDLSRRGRKFLFDLSFQRSVWNDIVSWPTELFIVSTASIDDHHFTKKMKSVGELSQVCSQIVFKCLYLARIGRPDILWSLNKLARSITKWTKACDKRLNRLISYIHHACGYRQYCHVGHTAKQCRLGLFQDSDFAGDLEDSKSTSGGTLCIVWESYICSNKLDVQETNCFFSQFNRIWNHLFGHWTEIRRDSCSRICILGLYSSTMPNKQRCCRQLQNHVRIANFSGRNRKTFILWEFWNFFMILWYGGSCKEMCGTIFVSWQTRRLNNSTKCRLPASMTTTSKKKKWNLLENCHMYALKLF